jgi:hypothetical protein
MPETLQLEIARIVSQAAAASGQLDIGEALKQLAILDTRVGEKRRDLVNALLSESLRAGVNPQLPIV